MDEWEGAEGVLEEVEENLLDLGLGLVWVS